MPVGSTLRTLLCIVVLSTAAACGGEPTVLRIPGSIRILEEPWQAWVSMEDEGVRVRLTYEPADGGPRERVLAPGEQLPRPAALEGRRFDRKEILRSREFPRVSTVLDVPFDRSWNRVLRRLPSDGIGLASRLLLAAPGRGGRRETLPILAPVDPFEVELKRLGDAVNRQDFVHGLLRSSATDLRITREGDRVRYRWGPSTVVHGGDRFTGGDVTLTDGQLRERGRGPILPALAKALEARTDFYGIIVVAVVILETTDEVLGIDVLRAVECARGDDTVCFFPWPWPWYRSDNPVHFHSIRAPRSTRELSPWSFLRQQQGTHPVVVSLTRSGETGFQNQVCPPDQLTERMDEYGELGESDHRADARFVLRFDGRANWADARPWVRRAAGPGVELALAFQSGDDGLDRETELVLPGRPGGKGIRLSPAEITARLAEVRGCVVRLVAPDSATVNDVWQAALALMNAGATGVKFE